MNRLPREFLWKNVESMDNFLHDPLNKELYEVYKTVKDKPFKILMPDVKVFNELYYLCIGLRFRDFNADELEDIILADTGHEYASSLLISMFFAVYAVQKIEIKDTFPEHIYLWFLNHGGWYFNTFKDFVKNLGITYQTDFSPRPENAKDIALKVTNWDKITYSYNHDDILRVLNLWEEEKDKLIILDAIETGYRNYSHDGTLIQKSDGSLIMPMDIDFQMFREYIIKNKPVSKPAVFCEDYPPTPDDKEIEFLSKIVLDSSLKERIIVLIKSRLKGKTEPKDIMRPFRAALYANAISRPKWKYFELTYGKEIVSKSSFNNYLNKDCKGYNEEQEYEWLLKEFKKIVG